MPKDGISGWPDYCGLSPVHMSDEPVKMQAFGWAGVRVMISYSRIAGAGRVCKISFGDWRYSPGVVLLYQCDLRGIE